jgi:prohibitin 1
MKTYHHLYIGLFALLATGCTIVRQGEVAARRTLGKINPQVVGPGLTGFNPFVTTIIKVPTRTINIEVRMPLPTKEGLTIQSDVSILYRVEGRQVPKIVETIGRNYEEVVILPIFRSAAADITASYFAKDMHTGQRAAIEKSISELMTSRLQDRGFAIESVLLKSIVLPPGLSKAIEDKLEAEQDAQRMEFVLAKQKQEAQRQIIEAEGIRDAQKIINEGLTPMLIQFKSIEAFNKLSASPNSKVIVTNGQTPMLLSPEQVD